MKYVFRFAVLAALAVPGFGATIGQIDTFEDGTTMGWGAGGQHPNPPTNVATGGPNGLGDGFLQIEATGGGGPGSKLAAFNMTQWAGDYAAAGIEQIRMSVRNFGPDDVFLRLLVLNFSGGFPSDMAITDAVLVAANGDWQSVSFDLAAADLTVLAGTAAGVRSNVQELRLFHNPNPTYPNPPIGPPAVTATIGVDNIQAAVPEPASVLLTSSGLLLALWARRLRRNAGRTSDV